MKILFLHGWQSTPGGVKPTYLKDHGHEVLNPALPDDDFDAAVWIAQAEFDQHRPDVVVGSSRGGAVTMNIDSGSTPLVLFCPAWRRFGTARTVRPGTIILHSTADDVVPFLDSVELVRNSGLPESALIVVGTEHRLADPESLAKMMEACERALAEAVEPVARPTDVQRFVEPRRITVCSGQYAHSSLDGGYTWVTALREVPRNDFPVSRGPMNLAGLPQLKNGACDIATVLDNGFGAVAGHEDNGDTATESPTSSACLFVTNHAGFSWKRLDVPGLSPRGLTQSECSSWPPGRFESMLVLAPGTIIVSWEDPWLYDCPMSHLVLSHDSGKSWHYNLLGASNPDLAHDVDGHLLCLNDGYYLLSDDGGATWRREDFHIEWPASYQDKKVSLLRHVVFVDRNLGYALIVHWSNRMSVSGVGLVVTTDNGRIWKHVSTLPGPNYGDVNSRHALSLRLQSM